MNMSFSALFSVRSVGIAFLALMISSSAQAQGRAPEHLTDSAQIAMFNRLTSKVNCYCGCHSIIGTCGHIEENCFGVQLRRFIENRIIEGRSESSIEEGLVSGFGEEIRKDPQVIILQGEGRVDLVSGFVKGFGKMIFVKPPVVWPWIVVAIVGAFALVWVWSRRNRPRPVAHARSPEIDSILNRTRELDR